MEFIYFDKISLVNADFALDLLEIADKYGMPELEKKCEDYLLYKITSQNVIRIAKLAERIGLINLKKNALKFMNKTPNKYLEKLIM